MISQIRTNLASISLLVPGTKKAYERKPKSLGEGSLPTAVVDAAVQTPEGKSAEMYRIRQMFTITWYCRKVDKDAKTLPEDEEAIEGLLETIIPIFDAHTFLGVGSLAKIPWVYNSGVQSVSGIMDLQFEGTQYKGFTVSFLVEYHNRYSSKSIGQ